jgi:hypothetical protein
MGFPRNTDVKKHLARKVHRTAPQLAPERLTIADELATPVIPPKAKAIELPIGAGLRTVLSDGSVG